MKPRVLLVVPSIPFPAINGGLLRIISLVRGLKDRCDFSLLSFVDRRGDQRFRQNAASLAVRDIFSEVHCVPRETTGQGPIPAGLPEAAREWYSPEMASVLRRLSARREADIVHFEFLSMASYVRDAGGLPTVWTEHDLSHLSFFRSYFREWAGWTRWTRVGEWLKTRRFHRDACRSFDRVIALTPDDQRRLRRTLPPEKLSMIPTCVDLARFSYRPEEGGERPVDLAYVGHYPHYPNEEAALWFCRRVLPRIRRARPGASLSLIGSSPTANILALAGAGIEVTGTVPRVAPYLDRAKVFVAPVRLGYGIKGKVLEAFARGIPVVATSVVRSGIPECRDGEHLLTADSEADFAKAVLRLLGDAALRRRLAERGRALVERHYDWEISCDKLDRLYRGLLAGRPKSVLVAGGA